jgi:hypothetical protein
VFVLVVGTHCKWVFRFKDKNKAVVHLIMLIRRLNTCSRFDSHLCAREMISNQGSEFTNNGVTPVCVGEGSEWSTNAYSAQESTVVRRHDENSYDFG